LTFFLAAPAEGYKEASCVQVCGKPGTDAALLDISKLRRLHAVLRHGRTVEPVTMATCCSFSEMEPIVYVYVLYLGIPCTIA
jgi:hypothetical protein